MNCAKQGCPESTGSGSKSKYCPDHAREARDLYLQRIRDGKDAKEQRDKDFAILFRKAYLAGVDAGEGCQPSEMVVRSTDLNGKVTLHHIPEGPCGFAWIVIRPGNCAAANYAKKHLGASKHYYGGIQIWVGEYNQSYERKMAHADAYARVLKDAGIKASSGGRLD